MNNTINVGVIGSGMSEETLMALAGNTRQRFYFKKIFPGNKIAESITGTQYPEAEIVHDAKAITDDTSIELVIVSALGANDSPVVEEALQAGKHVRIV